MNGPNDFNIKNGSLVEYCGSGGNVFVPQGVTEIGNDAFRWGPVLRYIILPDSIVRIGDYAFSDCRDLVDISIPLNLKSIGARAFAWCINLRHLEIPDSVKNIGPDAFYRCNNLTIRCPMGSYAEKYAREFGVSYTCD